MIGCAPVPYTPKVIGLPAEPDDGTVNCSRQVQVRSNRMESPGLNVDVFTLLMVSHGVAVLVPLFASLPITTQLSTYYVEPVGPGCVPVPESDTGCGLPLPLSVMASEATRVPVAEGVNMMAMVQLPPAATEAPQVST